MHKGVHVPTTRIRFSWMLIVPVMLVSTIVWAQEEQEGPPSARVRVGVIEQKEMKARWDVIGRLYERKRSVIPAEQAGRIIEMDVEDGDTVTAGKTVIARIDDVWAKLNVEDAKAQLDQAIAAKREAVSQLDQEKRDLAFYEDLATKHSAKPKEVEDARTTVEIAEARLTSASANLQQCKVMLERAEEQLARLVVKAPYDGVVIRKHTELGQWVNQGDAVAEIITTGQIEAHVDVPETLINNLSNGSNASLKVDALNLETQGKIIAIIPDASNAARMFPVHILLDNPNGDLKVGMSVTAHIPTSQVKPFLTVPRNAILTTALGSAMWVNMEGKAIRVDVTILFGLEDRYVVQPAMPLQPGMQVVIEGAERLFPTQPLEVIQ